MGKINNQKKTFKYIFIALAIILVLLPFVTTLNSFLTSAVNKLSLYKYIESAIIPWEARLVVVVVNLLGIEASISPESSVSAFFLVKGASKLPVILQWNCLGWQSLVLLFATFIPGLQGNFSKISKLEVVAVGILGTFLINIARMVFITVGLYYVDTVFATLIHDYFAALLTIVWLFAFWWFSYSFVLERNTQASRPHKRLLALISS